MTLLVGYHFQEDSYDGPAIGAATFLDVGGQDAASFAAERVCRPYVTGRPDPAAFVEQARPFVEQGLRVVCLNEPNLEEVEHFGGGPADYAAWFEAVCDRAPAGARLYYAGMSPGVPGWLDWYSDPAALRAIERAAGLCVHAYGDLPQMQETVQWVRDLFPGKPLWIGEFNFGAGRYVADVDAWAEQNIPPFLDWLNALGGVEAATWFSWSWDQSASLPSSVDAAGTAVEDVLRDWTPPANGGSMDDIVLSVETETAIASPANYGPSRARTIGVVIHTTRGGGPPEGEYDATVNWFRNPQAGVSAHLVVGSPAPNRVARCVHDGDTAWHARTANADHLGIEICQSRDGDPISDFAYAAAAEACRLWAERYGFPLERVFSEETPGLVGHADTESGRADGKTDPGYAFDWDRFLALCTGAAPPPDEIAALRDQVWALADQAEAAGAVWYGQALKAATALSKGER